MHEGRNLDSENAAILLQFLYTSKLNWPSKRHFLLSIYIRRIRWINTFCPISHVLFRYNTKSFFILWASWKWAFCSYDSRDLRKWSLETIILIIYLFCFQYLSSSVSAVGVGFLKATHFPTSVNLTDRPAVRSRFSCASLCSSQSECFAFSFSEQRKICNMYLSDENISMFTNGTACNLKTEIFCRGMCRVLDLSNIVSLKYSSNHRYLCFSFNE